MIKYCDLESKLEVWEVTRDDYEFEISKTAIISSKEPDHSSFLFHFRFKNNDLVNIPESIKLYDAGTNCLHHIQYFPKELIRDFELQIIGWDYRVHNRHLHGCQSEYYIHTYNDWVSGASYYYEFVPYSITQGFKMRPDCKFTYSKSNNYYYINFMSDEDKRKILTKKKALFNDYVDSKFDQFKSYFISKIKQIDLLEDKKLFRKRVLDSVECNLFEEKLSLREKNKVYCPPPISFLYKSSFTIQNENGRFEVPNDYTFKFQIYDHDCKKLRELYRSIFFENEKLFDFGFVPAPHFYNQYSNGDKLEVYCYALHEYRKWLKGYKIEEHDRQVEFNRDKDDDGLTPDQRIEFEKDKVTILSKDINENFLEFKLFVDESISESDISVTSAQYLAILLSTYRKKVLEPIRIINTFYEFPDKVLNWLKYHLKYDKYAKNLYRDSIIELLTKYERRDVDIQEIDYIMAKFSKVDFTKEVKYEPSSKGQIEYFTGQKTWDGVEKVMKGFLYMEGLMLSKEERVLNSVKETTQAYLNALSEKDKWQRQQNQVHNTNLIFNEILPDNSLSTETENSWSTFASQMNLHGYTENSDGSFWKAFFTNSSYKVEDRIKWLKKSNNGGNLVKPLLLLLKYSNDTCYYDINKLISKLESFFIFPNDLKLSNIKNQKSSFERKELDSEILKFSNKITSFSSLQLKN